MFVSHLFSIGSMVLYIVTWIILASSWIPSIYPLYVSINIPAPAGSVMGWKNLTCNVTSLMCVCCIITHVTTLVNTRHHVAWHLLSMQVALSFIALPHPTPYIRAQMNLIDIENGYRTRQHGFASAGTKRIDSLAELSRQSSLYCLVADFVGHWTQSRD